MNANGIKTSPIDMEARKKITFKAGDTVRVWQKIIERVTEKDKVKERSRLQAFEGLVLARKHGAEAGARFTVRRVLDGVRVEKIFPLYLPTIDRIEVLKKAKVRRAKLYHIRDKAAKEIKKEMKYIKLTKDIKEEVVAPKEIVEEKATA